MTPEEKKAAAIKITQEIVDEFLESLWLIDERGKKEKGNKSALCAVVVDEGLVADASQAEVVLMDMLKAGHIEVSGEDVSFRPGGREAAKALIRRKRLAEKLLAEVFELGPSEIKASACRFEHILSPEVTDSVCSFLGHPPTCPHGKPIPQGNCCKKLSHNVKPLVVPLDDLDPGSKGRIVFISPKDHGRMDRLSTLGIVPGTEITLHQKKPAFVIRSGETELALDPEIAREIYVRQIG